MGSLLAFYFWFFCGWLLCVGFVQAPLVGACLVGLLGSVRFEPAVSFVVHLAGFVFGTRDDVNEFKISEQKCWEDGFCICVVVGWSLFT